MTRPLQDFLDTEVAGGIVLMAAAILALVVANSVLGGSYDDFWETELKLGAGDLAIELDLRHWVNDGLMAIFFFVVGMEIKRELVAGELRSVRRAALPAVAAVGGMVVPAGIFMLFNRGTDEFRGWGIPMATDIAFAVGLLALFSSRVPTALKTFLLTLAVVDDLGAIAVIAVFYTESVDVLALAVAGLLVAGGLVMLRAGVRVAIAYLSLGIVLWIATYESGVHATLAGVVLAFLIPAHIGDDAPVLRDVTPSLLNRLEHSIHPWSGFLIVPLFAFANAGVEFSAGDLEEAAGTRLFLGIVVGLIAGKLIGITLFTWVAVKLRLGHLHPTLDFGHIVGAAAVAGIGFTVSLFISELAFDNPDRIDDAKLAILCGSLFAGLLASTLLLLFSRREEVMPAAEQ
ncbi:MAG TPA: Na+/H+ antiporter NhaA [Dehalococcoidia bacterium]|nr:Na+/H+ antiporter NhaA [Dehalococcoidia bacterium]